MPALAPPPDTKRKKLPSTPKAPSQTAPRDERHWMEKLSRSGYFLGAVLLHLVIFLIVATWVIFKAPPPPPDDFDKTYVAPSQPPPPPPSTPQQTMQVPSHVVAPSLIRSDNAQMPSFNIPMPNLTPSVTVDDKLTKIVMTAPKTSTGLATRLPTIMSTEGKWGRTVENIKESGGDPKNVVATFPVYLASYADGDWACNVHLDENGQIDAGSLPDLISKMNEWSHSQLKGTVIPTPLAIGSPDLIAKMPPFIFFTGHKDFILTPEEVSNLAKYLQNGGAIWGDNALAGEGSRFDIAFRREMRRVIPDVDKQFENLPLTHEIFTKSWFPMTEVPKGMNYSQEPLQHIDIDGKLAVIYTPNDYSDLLFMDILPGDRTYQWYRPTPPSKLFTSGFFGVYAGDFFRNFNLPACLEAHHLGMNIIAHLLVRFDKDLLLTN
jgi:hypothetical protein